MATSSLSMPFVFCVVVAVFCVVVVVPKSTPLHKCLLQVQIVVPELSNVVQSCSSSFLGPETHPPFTLTIFPFFSKLTRKYSINPNHNMNSPLQNHVSNGQTIWSV